MKIGMGFRTQNTGLRNLESRATAVLRFFLVTTIFFLLPSSLSRAVEFAGGTGEPNDPYQIATAAQLIGMGEDPNLYDKHFILTADIDLSDWLFDRAVIAPNVDNNQTWYIGTPFAGHFNGRGHVIHHLCIQGYSYIGLFGRLSSQATITGLGLDDVDLNGDCLVGSLVGLNDGACISLCYCSGLIIGNYSVGGLIGYDYCGHIHSSYSTGTIIGGNSGGGLIGTINNSSVTTCYSNGLVVVALYGGGLIGRHARGGNVSDSFWDIELSGLSISEGGQGLTTAKMQNVYTYLDSGWDFIDTWMICEGNYPRLQWENYICDE